MDTSSRSYQPTWGFTIYAYAPRVTSRSGWQRNTASTDSAITITGFQGTRLLDQPLDDMLADPQSNMPFCVCWANENWTRRWDGAEHEVLIAQNHLPNDDLAFAAPAAPFADPRYIRVDSKPFLIVYRPQHLPDARRTAAVWRDYCRSAGIGEIHLCAAFTHGNEDYLQFGFDSGVEFPPHNMKCPNVAWSLSFYEPFRGSVIEYPVIAQSYLERLYPGGNVYKSVFPAWDNTPRNRQSGRDCAEQFSRQLRVLAERNDQASCARFPRRVVDGFHQRME